MNCVGNVRECANLKDRRIPIAGISHTCGPRTNLQCPLILLDRALVYYREIVNNKPASR